MWVGVGLAVGLCAAAAITFAVVGSQLSFKARETAEGVLSLVAVAGVTYMIVWMHRHARELKGHLESRAALAIGAGSGVALALMAFFAVLREGLETAVFLLAAFQQTAQPLAAGLGALLGVIVAVVLGYGIYKGGIRINLARFFRLTGLVLVFVAAGLLASAAHEFAEAGLLTVGQQPRMDISWLVAPGTIRASLLTGMFGLQPVPTVAEVPLARLRRPDDLYIVPPARMTRRQPARLLHRLTSDHPRGARCRTVTRMLLALGGSSPSAVACTSTGGEGDVDVSLRDDAVVLSPATAEAGSVTFSATNEGTRPMRSRSSPATWIRRGSRSRTTSPRPRGSSSSTRSRTSRRAPRRPDGRPRGRELRDHVQPVGALRDGMHASLDVG